MILRDASGKEYTAHFRHRMDAEGYVNDRLRWKGVTECYLHAGNCGMDGKTCPVDDGIFAAARCSVLDRFDRRTGLKLAFGRAVGKMIHGQDSRGEEAARKIRGELWAAFFARVKRV
jgi:hypothetical protein